MTDQRLPPLPSLRELTASLLSLHEAWSHPDAGGEYVRLVCEIDGRGWYSWRAVAAGALEGLCVAFVHGGVQGAAVFGWEHIPGDGAPFDATAAARRLLAAARDALRT